MTLVDTLLCLTYSRMVSIASMPGWRGDTRAGVRRLASYLRRSWNTFSQWDVRATRRYGRLFINHNMTELTGPTGIVIAAAPASTQTSACTTLATK